MYQYVVVIGAHDNSWLLTYGPFDSMAEGNKWIDEYVTKTGGSWIKVRAIIPHKSVVSREG